MRVSARLNVPGGTLLVEGEQPFLVVGAEKRRPLAGPWIIVDADGDNAVRHTDEVRAFFAQHQDATAVAAQLNRARAA